MVVTAYLKSYSSFVTLYNIIISRKNLKSAGVINWTDLKCFILGWERSCTYLTDAEGVRVASSGLSTVEELVHARYPEQPVGANDDWAWDLDVTRAWWPPHVRQVRGQQAQQVEAPTRRRQVVSSQLSRVPHQQALLQVSCNRTICVTTAAATSPPDSLCRVN